jgi:Tat protein translocase TatB subunit
VFGIGMTELLVILVLGLLILGPKRLPDLARSLGRGLAEFRRASTEMRKEFLDVTEEARIDPFDDDASTAKTDASAVPPALGESAPAVAPEPPLEGKESVAPSGESEARAEKTTGTDGG